MIRRCDGNDPNLIMHVIPGTDRKVIPPFDPTTKRPCTCGREFNDVDHCVVWPHFPVNLSGWEPGVTPTFVQCQHGVIVAKGTYQRPVRATGEHRECWDVELADFSDAARIMITERGPAMPETACPVPPSHHTIALGWVDTARFHEWLNRPNGSLVLDQVTVDSVEGGGIMIRPHYPEGERP